MKRKICTLHLTNSGLPIRVAIAMLFLIMTGVQVAAQESTSSSVKGIVLFSEDNEPAPGVNIYLKGSPAKGTYSDAKGQFVFPHGLRSGDVLVFSFIGRESAEYAVHHPGEETIEIIMTPDPIQMVEDALVEVDNETESSRKRTILRRAKNNR